MRHTYERRKSQSIDSSNTESSTAQAMSYQSKKVIKTKHIKLFRTPHFFQSITSDH